MRCPPLRFFRSKASEHRKLIIFGYEGEVRGPAVCNLVKRRDTGTCRIVGKGEVLGPAKDFRPLSRPRWSTQKGYRQIGTLPSLVFDLDEKRRRKGFGEKLGFKRRRRAKPGMALSANQRALENCLHFTRYITLTYDGSVYSVAHASTTRA